MSAARPRSPLGLRALLPLYAVVFAGFFGYSLMITVFTPLLLHEQTGMLPAAATQAHRTIVLGALLFLYPFGQFIGSPILGAASDRLGRKPVLLASLTVTTCCYAVIAFALHIANLGLLGATCFIAGLAEANVVTAQAAISDVIPPAERNRYFGYIYMSASLAYIVGPLIGGKLADQSVVAWFNDAVPFWATFVLLASTTVAAALTFHETRIRDESRPAPAWLSSFLSLGTIVADRTLRRYYLANALLYLAIFGFFRSYPMYLVSRFDLDVGEVSKFVAWVGVPIVVGNFWLTGFVSRRVPLKTLTIWSAALTGIFVIAVVLPSSLGPLWPLLFCAGLALAIGLPSCATLLSQAAGPRDQGQVMGDNQALQVAAEAFSGLFSGFLAAIALALPLAACGACALAGALAVALLL